MDDYNKEVTLLKDLLDANLKDVQCKIKSCLSELAESLKNRERWLLAQSHSVHALILQKLEKSYDCTAQAEPGLSTDESYVFHDEKVSFIRFSTKGMERLLQSMHQFGDVASNRRSDPNMELAKFLSDREVQETKSLPIMRPALSTKIEDWLIRDNSVDSQENLKEKLCGLELVDDDIEIDDFELVHADELSQCEDISQTMEASSLSFEYFKMTANSPLRMWLVTPAEQVNDFYSGDTIDFPYLKKVAASPKENWLVQTSCRPSSTDIYDLGDAACQRSDTISVVTSPNETSPATGFVRTPLIFAASSTPEADMSGSRVTTSVEWPLKSLPLSAWLSTPSSSSVLQPGRYDRASPGRDWGQQEWDNWRRRNEHLPMEAWLAAPNYRISEAADGGS